MKTRQFKQLASQTASRRDELLIEGLFEVAVNVDSLIGEIETCGRAGADRAAAIVRNVGREEAGKFLVLMDVARGGQMRQELIAQQCGRAGSHLAKLIYAQMADYSIGDRAELVRAITGHRQGLYLDGPNDFDFIMRNDLIEEREGQLYVDLVDIEGVLQWWTPGESGWGTVVPRSMRLVSSIAEAGLVSPAGLRHLRAGWDDFDHDGESAFFEWSRRTHDLLVGFAEEAEIQDPDWGVAARSVIDLWPMPLVHLDLSEIPAKVSDLQAERELQKRAWMEREFGPFD